MLEPKWSALQLPWSRWNFYASDYHISLLHIDEYLRLTLKQAHKNVARQLTIGCKMSKCCFSQPYMFGWNFDTCTGVVLECMWDLSADLWRLKHSVFLRYIYLHKLFVINHNATPRTSCFLWHLLFDKLKLTDTAERFITFLICGLHAEYMVYWFVWSLGLYSQDYSSKILVSG